MVERMAETAVVKTEAKAIPARVRLEYLDGLRGLAALYVVMYHASDPTWAGGTLPHRLAACLRLLVYGHFAVAVFIVLSGYCLMLPVARAADRQLRGGAGEYLRRRARRILPPYYAALLVTLLLMKLVPQLHMHSGNYWDGALPAFRTDVLLSHLFLVHNLSSQWNWKIDPPLWSVATEWQIYFFFPFVLLPLWRRFGLAAAVISALLLGLAPHFLLPQAWSLDVAVPWYLGLFGIGMGAAIVNFAQDELPVRLRSRIPWGTVTALQFLLLLGVALLRSKWWWAHLWFADTQIGLCTASFLIFGTQQCHNSRPHGLIRLLQVRPVVFLGTMSYSLYLIHAPLLALLHLPLVHLIASPSLRLGMMIFVLVPITVLLAYLFHVLFERRYMSPHGSKASAAA